MTRTPGLRQPQAATLPSTLPSRLRASGRVVREVVLIGIPALLVLPSAGDVDPTGGLPGGLTGGLTAQGWVHLVAALAVVALLLVRRRSPLVAVAGMTVLVAVAGGGVWLASLVVLLSVVTRAQGAGQGRRVLVAAGSLWMGYAVRVSFTAPVPQPPWSSLNGLITVVFWGVVLALVTCVGLYRGARRQLLISAQERAQRAEADQQRSADMARQRERALIAREMHDVLAHRLSVLALHAGALEYRADVAGGEVAAAAGVVRRSAREAMQDLRQVLGVLREDPESAAAPVPELTPQQDPRAGVEQDPSSVPTLPDDDDHRAAAATPRAVGDHAGGHGREGLRPLPDLAQVGALVQEARVTGAQVGLRVDGDLRAVPTALGRAGYRVVQEGLTNARKHAAGAPVWVDVAITERELTIEVRNAARPAVVVGAGAASARANTTVLATLSGPLAGADLDLPGSGTGLIGVDERAAMLGGRAEHGATPDGGYGLRVDLPLPQRSPDSDAGTRPGPGRGRSSDVAGAATSRPAGAPVPVGHPADQDGGGQPGEQPGSLRGGAER